MMPPDWPGISLAVSTARTPGAARASEQSTSSRDASGTELVANAACNPPWSIGMSSTKVASPAAWRYASSFWTGWDTGACTSASTLEEGFLVSKNH